jgi:hypothetical protein
VRVVIHFEESTGRWEKAFLSAQVWSTSVFWQCVVSFLVPWSAIAALAAHLSKHKPRLFESFWVAGLILCAGLIFYAVTFIARTITIRRRLQQANAESEEYKALVMTAKSLTRRFIRTSLGLGVAISIMRVYLW